MFTKPERLEIYKFTPYPKTATNGVDFPPHLDVIPKDETDPLYDIFDKSGLLETMAIIGLSFSLNIKWPDAWTWTKKTMGEYLDAYVESNKNNFIGHEDTDIEADPQAQNIGCLPDWFSDRRFAEQSLTGTNPTTLRKVDDDLLKEFIDAAQDTGETGWAERLRSVDQATLFVQDARYIREAVGAAPDAELKHKEFWADMNWACCAVTLYELHSDGKLHPAAIVVDYKVTMRQSITIFNKRLLPTDLDADEDTLKKALAEEETDWPWRYAKTCAQVSDWVRHEVGVHLTLSHLVEEVVIVASKRCFDEQHPVYRLLSPHWVRTLSLNASARSTLVPYVIKDIVGMDLNAVYSLIRYEFDHYDFVGSYVPNDLKRRGFPHTPHGLEDDRYKNYAYAKDIILMWEVLRKFVVSTLQLSYSSDEQVASDPSISEWCKEIQTLGAMPTFPTVQTLDDLADAITMCIHIAAPFHTAVNYLQNFYQAFVFAKPPALCAPLPKDLYELQHYDKDAFASALHIKRHRQWLLSEQLPWLLSFKVESSNNLQTFAESHQLLAGTDEEEQASSAIIDALEADLEELTAKFREISHRMDRDSIPYTVLEPSNTAVSILI